MFDLMKSSVNFLRLFELLRKLFLLSILFKHVPKLVIRSGFFIIIFGLYFGFRDGHIHKLSLFIELSEILRLLLSQLVQFLCDLDKSNLGDFFLK